MTIEHTTNTPLYHVFTLTAAYTDLTPHVDAFLENRAKTHKEPGFRPGLVPRARLVKIFGTEAKNYAIEQCITQQSQEILQGKTSHFSGEALNPRYELLESSEEKGLTWTLSFDCPPVLPALSWGRCHLTQHTVTPDEADIQAQKKDMLPHYTASTPLSPEDLPGLTAQMGHTVFFTLDDTPLSLALTEETLNSPAGRALQGVTIGEHVKLPKDKKDKKTLALITDIQTTVPATLKTLYTALNLKSEDDLHTHMKDHLAQEGQKLAHTLAKKQVLDFLAQQAFDLPASMVDKEFDYLWNNLLNRVPQGSTLEEFLEMSQDEAKTLYHALATRRLRISFLLQRETEALGLSISEQDWIQALYRECQKYPGQEEKLLTHYRKNKGAAQQLRLRILEDKYVDHVFAHQGGSQATEGEKATIEVQDCTYLQLKEMFDASVETSEEDLRNLEAGDQATRISAETTPSSKETPPSATPDQAKKNGPHAETNQKKSSQANTKVSS